MKQLTLFLFLCITLSLNAQMFNTQDVNSLKKYRQQNGVGFEPMSSGIKQATSNVKTNKDDLQLRFVGRTLSKSNSNPNMTKIIVNAKAQTANVKGFQMLLDSTHTQFGKTIPSGIYNLRLSTTDLADSVYKLFSYHLPTVINGSISNCLTIEPQTSDSVLIRPGTYDFAFIYPRTNAAQYGFWLINGSFARQNDFIFEAGYTYTFDIEGERTVGLIPPFDIQAVKIILPQNGKLTNKEFIGLELFNRSKDVDVMDYNIMYQINDGPVISEKNKKTLGANDTINYYFAQQADFSKPGLYKIKAWVSFDKDLQRDNDTLSTYCKHLEVLPLPFKEYFMSDEEFQSHWNILDANADGNSWRREPYLGTGGTGEVSYNSNSNKADDYLISDPINLPKEKLHLVFDCKHSSFGMYQNLTILYGTSPAPSKMMILKEYDSIEYTDSPKKYIINFTPTEAGEYSFAFRTTSETKYGTLIIQNVIVDKGDYIGSPDLDLLHVDLPLSACDLQAPEEIRLQLANNGTEDLNSFNFKIIINDSVKYSEQVSKLIPAGDTIDMGIWPWPLLDLSEKKLYNVSCIVDVERDLNQNNDTIRHRIINYDPITEMPFHNYFSTNKEADNWYSQQPQTLAWVYDNGYRTWEGYNDSVHLISRCFTLEPGTYIFGMKYSAGFQLLQTAVTECFKVSIGEANTDVNTWETFMYLQNIIGRELYSTSFFTVTEKKEYSFSIMTTDENGLNMGISSIFGIDIEKLKDHDLSLSQFESTLSSTIPIEHLSVDPTFKASIVNIGVQTENNVKLEIKDGQTSVASVVSDQTISLNDTLVISTKGKIGNPTIGKSIELIATVSMENEDNFIENNVKKYSFVVSDTILASDKVKELSYGLGSDSQISFGNIFTISTADTLTEVKTLVTESASTQTAGLTIYLLDSMKNITKKILETEFKRSTDSGEISIKFPAQILKPGIYYFEINQKTLHNIGIANDEDPEGVVYIRNSSGKLNPDKSNGNIAVRPIFGHHAKIYQFDAGVAKISKPKTSGVFSINETVVASIQNFGTKTLTALPVHCSLNGVELTPVIIDTLHPYSNKEVKFTVDLSKVQTHVLEIWTKQIGDENPSNDREQKNIISKEMPSPYFLDFEECEEFSINKLIPNWTTVDRDKERTATLKDYSFENAGKPAAYIVFNPLLTTPAMDDIAFLAPKQGSNYGASFSSYTVTKDDWLISPKLKMGQSSSLSLWVKTAQESEGVGDRLEQYNILVSETDSDPDSFEAIGNQRSAPLDWDNVTIDLNKYNNKDIYVAIQCVSRDVVMFLIDDIQVQTNLEDIGVQPSEKVKSISLFPNPATDYVNIYSPITDITSVEVYSLNGYLVYRSAANLKHRSLRISTTSFAKGTYFIKVLTNDGVQTLKFVNL